MNVPVAAMLAAFACGVAAIQTLAELPRWPAAIALVAAGGLVALLRGAPHAGLLRLAARARIDGAYVRAAALVIAATALGVGYAAWRAEARLADALAPEAEGADVHLVGIVDDLPHNGPQGARFAFAVERVLRPAVGVPARISVAWFAPRGDGDGDDDTRAAAPEVHAGERWRLAVRLRRPHGYVNPAGFDLEAWLLERNLRAAGYVRDHAANERLTTFAGRPSDHVQRAREAIRARILSALPGAPTRACSPRSRSATSARFRRRSGRCSTAPASRT